MEQGQQKSHNQSELAPKCTMQDGWWLTTYFLTRRSVSSLNNPQNSEMTFCENMKLTC